ncbi:hypothetical protein D9754_00420 [Planomicrobium sp. Y74]|nr:hypothetical protein D9754_00420 [Planomicrobium sp. Y74]
MWLLGLNQFKTLLLHRCAASSQIVALASFGQLFAVLLHIFRKSLSKGAAQEQANADGAKTSGLLGLLRELRCAMNLRRLLCDEQCAGA